MGKKDILKFEGSSFFRQRIVLATLSNQPIKITHMNSHDLEPGIKDFQLSLLRMIEQISSGALIELNETATDLYYKPGLLTGGAFEHGCCIQRSLGYYLEALLCLAPFVKNPIKARLFGITNDNVDPSVDAIKASSLPIIKRFLHWDDGDMDVPHKSQHSLILDIRIVRRSFPIITKSSNNIESTVTIDRNSKLGEILFTCPVYRTNLISMYNPINLIPNATKSTLKDGINSLTEEIDDINEPFPNENENEKKSAREKAGMKISGKEKMRQRLKSAGTGPNSYKIVKIRGIAYTVRTSPAIANRIINEAQTLLKNHGSINNYIRVDSYKKSQSGPTPGFGLCLYAYTLNGCVYCAEYASYATDKSIDDQHNENDQNLTKKASQLATPEEIAQATTCQLLNEIYMGGSTDSWNQSLALLYMALASNKITRIMSGPFTPYTLKNLRFIEDIFKIKYKIDRYQDELESERDTTNNKIPNDYSNNCKQERHPVKYVVSCLGSGFYNINKTLK